MVASFRRGALRNGGLFIGGPRTAVYPARWYAQGYSVVVFLRSVFMLAGVFCVVVKTHRICGSNVDREGARSRHARCCDDQRGHRVPNRHCRYPCWSVLRSVRVYATVSEVHQAHTSVFDRSAEWLSRQLAAGSASVLIFRFFSSAFHCIFARHAIATRDPSF